VNRLLQNRLLLQLFFTFVAALSVATLSVVLITEAIGSAERVVLGEANRTIATAIAELKQQYQYRAASDSSWSSLPARARGVSLRGITQTVLRSYPGVEGGFHADADFLGYAFPTHDTGSAKTDVPSAERDLIVSMTQQSQKANHFAARVIRGKSDLLVLGAEPSGGAVVWAMKRLAGRGTPGAGRRELLLSTLVLAALVSIAGTLATGLSLARGVAQIQNGLARLEQDFEFRLPRRPDELGRISESINRMASVRRKLESELRQEDRLRAAGRLAAAVQMEVDRLGVLLNDLLDLQRSRQPRPGVQSVLPVVEHCISLVERQADMQNAVIRLENASEEAGAFFDSQQLIANRGQSASECPGSISGGWDDSC
jgi:hypothetical protein